jgi:hypothetical protein
VTAQGRGAGLGVPRPGQAAGGPGEVVRHLGSEFCISQRVSRTLLDQRPTRESQRRWTDRVRVGLLDDVPCDPPAIM